MSREQHETFEKTEHADVQNSTLILDLNGPFVLHLTSTGTRIYAPPCQDHCGNLLTDTNDIPLYGLPQDAASPPDGKGWVYGLSFNSRGPGKGSCKTQELLKIKFRLPPIAEASCSFVLQAPSPDEIVALHPEPIWIHQNSAHRWVDDGKTYGQTGGYWISDKRARGLRLIYRDCCSDPTVTTVSNPSGAVPPDFSKICFWTRGLQHAYRNISLRFAANRATSDDHHEDAYNCFQTARKLVSGTDPDNWDIDMWRVDFDDSSHATRDKKPYSIFNLTGKHPSDCGALALVIQDPQ